jgi:hypothetical protein
MAHDFDPVEYARRFLAFGTWWRAEQPGEMVGGKVVRVFEVTSRFKGKVPAIAIETREGHIYNVTMAGAVLGSVWQRCAPQVNDDIVIKYVGEKQSKDKRMPKPYKNYVVLLFRYDPIEGKRKVFDYYNQTWKDPEEFKPGQQEEEEAPLIEEDDGEDFIGDVLRRR